MRGIRGGEGEKEVVGEVESGAIWGGEGEKEVEIEGDVRSDVALLPSFFPPISAFLAGELLRSDPVSTYAQSSSYVLSKLSFLQHVSFAGGIMPGLPAIPGVLVIPDVPAILRVTVGRGGRP